ncbi:MAG TPA: 50S ribosomal protein L21e [archaeon]|nr:50S ribosomal protein L21e [archaeon]
MVSKSHGPHRKTREKFRKSTRMTVNQFMKEFPIGTKVVIDIESGSSGGVPFRRFQGLTGKVIERKGRAYVLEIKDGNKVKKVISNPEHLKAA